MKNKGFTLIELLVCISIIALLAGVAVTSYEHFINNSKEKVYLNYEGSMKTAAQEYYIDHSNEIVGVNGTATITIQTLVGTGYLEYFKSLDSGDRCLNSYVSVQRDSNEDMVNLEYNSCLICNNYQTEGCD